MGYSIKVLTSKEFDKLPYRFVDQAFAVTSPRKDNIYVRHTNIHDFNKMLIGHELDHLVEDYPTDEGPNGERYFLSGLLSGLGSLATSAFSGLGSSFSGGLNNLIGGLGGQFLKSVKPVNPLHGATLNLASNLLSGGGLSSIGNFLNPQQLSYQRSMIPGGYNPNSGGGGGGGGGGLFGNILKGLTGGLGGGLGGIMNLFKQPQTQLGTGLLGAGLAWQPPKFPNISQLSSVNNLRGLANSGGTPLNQQASGVVSGNLNKQFNPLTSAELTAATSELDRNKLEDIKRLEDLYSSVRPGTDYTTDSTYKQDLANIERQYSESKANTVANRTRDAESNFNNFQLQNVLAARGFNQDQINAMTDIANLDVQEAMSKYNISYENVQNIKSVIQSLGGQLLLSGMNAGSPLTNFSAGGF